MVRPLPPKVTAIKRKHGVSTLSKRLRIEMISHFAKIEVKKLRKGEKNKKVIYFVSKS